MNADSAETGQKKHRVSFGQKPMHSSEESSRGDHGQQDESQQSQGQQNPGRSPLSLA
jgi:hypothetical protein